jgi:hypothetical protein
MRIDGGRSWLMNALPDKRAALVMTTINFSMLPMSHCFQR